ncbi:MAG TPA: NAD(P)H-dependent oxidoreductase [Candidatus Limiplasma sp.]|nr:NAD(P)H-dependent oxidoreductase [Candidatus Limiplasma sp.]HRX07726.1 NAD(P)H-dependent oxidoreductase [Candidatus Limiplasma sp.]
MKAYILSDGEFATNALEQLNALVRRVLDSKGFAVTEKRLQPQELAYCRGCFGCWVKTPGECVIRDSMADINRDSMQSDVAVYLVPVVFGQYSANMKNALDRWIPNILPFFEVRKNGETIHPARYLENPAFIMIGYGDGLSAEEKALFTSITTNHRENGIVLFYEGDDQKTEQALDALKLEKAGALV